MSRRYISSGEQAASVTAADDTILTLDANGTTVRGILCQVLFGSADAPADFAYNLQVQRLTAPGTGDAVTPEPLDPANPASLYVALENHSAAPTWGAVVLDFSINHKDKFEWYVPPEEGIVMPATAAAGVGLTFIVASTVGKLCQAQFVHEE